MSADELKNIVAQFNEQGKMWFLEGASEKQISGYEKEHTV